MTYPVILSRPSRRTFAKLCAATFATLPLRAIACPSHSLPSEAFSISLELSELGEADGRLQFVIRLSNPAGTPALLTSIQLFAPGDSMPRKARFDLAGADIRPSYTGRLQLERSQNVMALAELADGTFVHDRRFVSLTVA